MRTSAWLFLVAVVTGACASGGAGGVTATTVYAEKDAKLFGDAADVLENPDALEGKWGADWDSEMQGRVHQSDLIAVVKITTLRTDVDPQGITTYRIVASPKKVWKGEVPGDGLSLSVKEGAVGYATIDTQRQKILDSEFIAFVKWFLSAEGTAEPHWHLAIATEPVLKRVRTHMEQLAPTHKTVTMTHVQTD